MTIERIGAILDSNSETRVVRFLGYGTYAGKEIPPKDVSPFLAELGWNNPKLNLDNGETAWGCQCWWSSEEAIKSQLEDFIAKGYEIVEVKLSELEDE